MQLPGSEVLLTVLRSQNDLLTGQGSEKYSAGQTDGHPFLVLIAAVLQLLFSITLEKPKLALFTCLATGVSQGVGFIWGWLLYHLVLGWHGLIF